MWSNERANIGPDHFYHMCTLLPCPVFAQLKIKMMNQTSITEDMNSHHLYRNTVSIVESLSH